MKTIHVTQDHINRGVPNSPCGCPVNLAVRDALGLSDDPDRLITTGLRCGENDPKPTAVIHVNGESFYGIESVDSFVERFDNREPVEPFTFELNL